MARHWYDGSIEETAMGDKTVVLAVAIAMLAVGCSRSDEATSTSSSSSVDSTSSSSSTTSTSTTSTTSTTDVTTTTVAPTTTTTTTSTTSTTSTTTSTTVAAPGCGALPVLPPGIVETAVKLIDMDADGFADTVRSYATGPAPVAGDWHLRVELAAGGGADLALPFDPAPAGVTVLGGAYVGSTVDPGPEGPRPAMFVKVGAGASASIIELYRLVGCAIAPVGGSEFPVGGGVVHTEHLRCEGVAGTSLLVYITTEYDDAAGTHQITQTAYTRAANALVPFGTPSVTTSATFPIHNLIDNCGVDSP